MLEEDTGLCDEGSASSKRAIHLCLEGVQRSHERTSARLASLSFRLHESQTRADANDDLRAGNVSCCTALSRVSTLAVVDGRDTSNFELLDSSIQHFEPSSLREGSEWSAVAVCSVLLQQRCIDTCMRRPSPPFMKNCWASSRHRTFVSTSTHPANCMMIPAIVTKIPVTRRTQIRQVVLQQRRSRFCRRAGRPPINDDVATAAASGASTRVSGLWSTILRRHTSLRDDIVLLQGPPGTGKTTTLVQPPRAREERAEGAADRLLVCAPSNRECRSFSIDF